MIQIIAAVQAIMTKMRQDHIAAFAAQAAFFIIISTFPFIMFILYITRYMPFNQADILMACREYLPGQYSSLVVSIIEMVYVQQSTALLSFNALSLLWAATKGVNSLISGLNSVYNSGDYFRSFTPRIRKYNLYLYLQMVPVFGRNQCVIYTDKDLS